METLASMAVLDEIDRQITAHTKRCDVSEPDAGCDICDVLWRDRSNAHA